VPFGRIHAMEARQPLLWRPFGWWRVRITTAGHSLAQGGQNKMQNMVLPVGFVSDVQRVFENVLPGAVAPAEAVEAPETAAVGEATAGFVSAEAAVSVEETAPAVSAELMDELVGSGTGYTRAGRGAGWVLWFGRRRAGVRVVDPAVSGSLAEQTASMTGPEKEASSVGAEQVASLRIRRGALTRSLGVMPLVRAQSVQLRRPLVHRMIGLASIQAHTVLGPLRMEMRGLDLLQAQGIFDRLAAAVVHVQAEETEQRGRMWAVTALPSPAPAPSLDSVRSTDTAFPPDEGQQ